MSHPAKFSAPIIAVIREILLNNYPEWFGRPVLFDAFAGDGSALHALCADLGWLYSGCEIEASFINAPGIRRGDACDPSMYPPVTHPNETATSGWIVVTSPPYGNGLSDHAVANDASKRYTYRKAISTIEGVDRELHESNLGRYGYRSTKRDGKSTKRAEYWRIADKIVGNWSSASMVILNVSDFIARGQVEPHVADWKDLLARHGWTDQTDHPVGTQRMRNGENADQRVDHEVVIVGRRA
jgi:hypothetical protein